MNPTCAACRKPLRKGKNSKVTIVGTEAFHQACVLAGGVAKSVNNELRQAIRSATDQAKDLSNEICGVAKQISQLQADADKVRERNIMLQGDVLSRDLTIGGLRTDLTTRDQRVRELEKELADLRKAPTKLVPDPTPQDETAIRFGLLEFK